MKERMQRDEQEATARSLPVFIYISQRFQLAAAAQQAGRERQEDTGTKRESERVCCRSPWRWPLSL